MAPTLSRFERFGAMPPELRQKLWEVVASEPRFIGAAANRDLSVVRQLSVISKVNRESRRVFNRIFARLVDSASYHRGPDGTIIPGNVADHVYFNPGVDTMTLGYETTAPFDNRRLIKPPELSPEKATEIKDIWLHDLNILSSAQYHNFDDLVQQHQTLASDGIHELPELFYPNLQTVWISSARIDYDMKVTNEYSGLDIRYIASRGKVFLRELDSDTFNEGDWINENSMRRDGEDFNAADSFVIRIQIIRGDDTGFTNDGEWSIVEEDSYSDEEDNEDGDEYEKASVEWRAIWQFAAEYVALRLGPT